MLTPSVVAGIRFESYEISQLAFILIPMFLFAVHKLISTCLRHRIKKLKIEKGIVSSRSRNHGGAKWIRSIYTAVALLLAAGAFAWYVIEFQGGFEHNSGPFLMFVLPLSCAGIAYFFRGILKRKSYLRKLALNNGVPFEVVCPPQKHWALPMAIGLPLLIYAGVVFALCIASNSGGEMLGISIIVAGILGGMFFLYGLIMCIVIGRNRRRAVRTTITPAEPAALQVQPSESEML
jgi:hypothetical protein